MKWCGKENVGTPQGYYAVPDCTGAKIQYAADRRILHGSILYCLPLRRMAPTCAPNMVSNSGAGRLPAGVHGEW